MCPVQVPGARSQVRIIYYFGGILRLMYYTVFLFIMYFICILYCSTLDTTRFHVR